MVSSWLPQNIQKRIFKYFLNRLSVFSNLDLENVDVSVGTTSNFSLSDVQLDTEKITFPGVYLRDGHIRKLDIKLGMMGGVNIDGSDIDLSIALSSPRIEDLSTLLSRTTADLAHSIVLPGEDMEDEEADADSFENEGFGFGEFKPTVIKAVDVAISQLSINLCNISIRLTVDHETTLLLSIGRITMRTMDPGIRHVVVSDVEVVLVSPDLHTLGSGQLNDATDTSHPSTEEGGDFNELEASQLMESMVFSHEEASSMYMSALSTVLEETQNAPPKPRILWCRKADVHFKGLGEDITFDIDQVHGSLYPIPVVLMSLLKKFKEIMMSDGSLNKSATVVDDDEEKETEATYNRFAKISIASVSLGIGTLLPNGLFEDPDMIVFTLSECSLDLSRSSSLFLVNKISVNTGEKNILKFKKGNDSELDFTCQLVSSGITILLPNPAFMNLSLKELGPLLASLREINLALATVSQSSEMEPNIKRDESSTANVYIQTNTFEICLDSGSLVSTITIFPATAKDDLMQIDKIIIKLQHDLITARNLVISLNHNSLTHIIQQDSMEVQAEVGTSVTLDSLLIDGSHSSLIHLLQDFQKWSIPENQTIVLSDQSPTTTPTMAPQTPRGVQISVKKIPISVKIIKIEIKIRLPKQIGIFDADAGNTIVNIIASDIVQISISTIYLSRDFSDIDPTVKHIPLVYNAIPSKVSFELHVIS